MPKQTESNQNRNANSGASSEPAGQSTVQANSNGTLPVSALAEVLVKNFQGQGAEETNAEGTPAEGAGTTNAPGPEAGAGATGTDADGPTEGNEGTEAGEGSTEEAEELPRENAEGTEDENEEEGQPGADTPGVRKRIGKLQGRIQELEKKLEGLTKGDGAQGTARAAGPMPLQEITDLGELDRRAEAAEAGLEEVDTLLARLNHAPQKVEGFLRSNKVVLTDGDGNEDFSTERMAECLAQARTGFRQTLRAIPQRRSYLQQYAVAHAQVVAELPWVADPEDERHAVLQGMAQQFPNIRALPNWEYWAAAAIEGDRVLKARRKNPKSDPATAGRRPNNGNGDTLKRELLTRPNTGSGGAAAPRVRTEQVKVDQAREQAMKEGSRKALSGFLTQSGYVK